VKITDLLRKSEPEPEAAAKAAADRNQNSYPEPTIFIRETAIPIGRHGDDDARPELDRDTLIQWSMNICQKIDASVQALSNEYVFEPIQLLALYANIGTYCMGIANTVHQRLTTDEQDGRPTEPLPTRHWDPNAGYL